MRRQCSPLLVFDDGNVRALKRLQLSDRHVHEEYLQKLIHSSPSLLPVEELDSSFAPLISLGTEVPTEAGFIDNLLISPTGRLTLVETKLWRNPQATREVVAQVIDYAKALRYWSYDDLEKAVSRAHNEPLSSVGSLYSLMAERVEVSEQEFVDEVQRTLASGRFLLLVVGDGIRENIERMVNVLHTAPDLLFTFGLIELQLFEAENPASRIVLPNVVAHTIEIVRAVVRLEEGVAGKVSITIEEGPGPRGPRRRLTEEEFFASLKVDSTRRLFRQIVELSAELGAEPQPGQANLPVHLADPAGTGRRFTLFVLTSEGTIVFGWLASQLKQTGYPDAIAWDMLSEIAGLFSGVEVKESEALTRSLRAEEVEERLEDFMNAVARVVQRLRTETP
jgi:hypothetical protein